MPSARIPWRVMSASRWHMPPVCSCTDGTPAASIVSASTALSMSASITPQRSRPSKALFSARSVVVFPLPGEDIRFIRQVPPARSSSRRA